MTWRAGTGSRTPSGSLQGLIDHVADRLGAHLILAGPAADSVHDGPEGQQVLGQVVQALGRAAARQTGHIDVSSNLLRASGSVGFPLQKQDHRLCPRRLEGDLASRLDGHGFGRNLIPAFNAVPLDRVASRWELDRE